MVNPIPHATRHNDRGKINHTSPAINTDMRVGKAFLNSIVAIVTNDAKKEDSDMMMTYFQSAFAFNSPLT